MADADANRLLHGPYVSPPLRRGEHRGPANQSPIVLWTYPIDPRPGGPLPDASDLLFYVKKGNRPQLLGHLSEVFPRHGQIHCGRYRREERFEAARRSRARASSQMAIGAGKGTRKPMGARSPSAGGQC